MCICNYLATSGLNHHFIVGGNQKSNDLATSRPFFFFGDFQTRLPKIGDFQTGTRRFIPQKIMDPWLSVLFTHIIPSAILHSKLLSPKLNVGLQSNGVRR